MRPRNSFHFKAFACALALALAPAAAARAGLVIEQRSNGLSGASEEAKSSSQVLTVGHGSILMRPADDKGARYAVVNLEHGVLREIDPKLKLFTETSLSRLRQKREDAERQREEVRERMLDLLKTERWTEEKVDEELAKHGLRRDGQRIRTVDKRAEKVGEYQTLRYTIRINGKAYLDVWATDQITEYKAPRELYDFYDKAGLFPDDVVEVLRRIEGFPVRIRADLDYVSTAGTLEVEVTRVMAYDPRPEEFHVPEGFSQVDRFPDPTAEAHVHGTCPVCGGTIERPVRPPGTTRFVCSRACQLKFARNPSKYRDDGKD